MESRIKHLRKLGAEVPALSTLRFERVDNLGAYRIPPETAFSSDLFTTSLMTSAVSRYLGLFFHDFEHTFHVSAHALVPFERVTMLRR
jgi:hypothetical protein